MPRTYGLVARHSASFLKSLSTSWSCLNSNGVHSTHTAKLFLETDASDSCVNFRMILEYETISGNLRQQYVDGFIMVEVSKLTISVAACCSYVSGPRNSLGSISG